MKIKVLITIIICTLVVGIQNVYAGRGGSLDINKTLCYYEAVATDALSAKNADENAIIYIKPNTSTGYNLVSQFIETNLNLKTKVGSSGTIEDGFLYYTESGWKKPKSITQNETENLLSYLDNYGKCPAAIQMMLTGKGDIKSLVKLQMYAYEPDIKNVNDRAKDLVSNGFDGAVKTFSCVLNECFLVFGSLKYYAVNYNASSLFTNECLDDSTLNEFYTSYDNIVNHFPKNSNYIKKFKNSDYKTPTQIIIDRYSEGGKCYESATDSVKQTYYKKLTTLAGKALKLMDSTDTSSNSTKAKNNCQKILGDPNKAGDFAYYLDKSFKFIKFLAPLILIVVSVIDYIKVIASADADLINKTNKKTIVRIIFALLLFVLPIIISYLLTLLGAQGKCEFPSIPGI